jgi:hypothetical protein
MATNPLEKLKLVTTYAMTTVHLAVAQLKPFNPILGETFQSKVEDSLFYIEQTCHHPPVLNFLFLGKNHKAYGYNESEVSTGANSIRARYKGTFNIQLNDGSTYKIFFPEFKLSGTLFGNRSIKYHGTMNVVDEANDLLAYVEMEPDDRGFFKKIFSRKKGAMPDYFKGIITILSKNSKFDKKENCFTNVDQSKHILCSIEGEFTNYVKLDGVNYWEHDKCEHPPFKRMSYTLPSDSTFREDLNWLKKGDEGMSQKTKIKLEDIQRHEKRLREKNEKYNRRN